MTEIPEPFGVLEERGRRLWDSIHEQHPNISDAETEVALEACRVADRLERLDVMCRANEPVLETEKGQLITHPAFAEARQQANLLKQLVASLRMPEPATGRRPQVRSARGVQQPKGAGSVSSLELARTRKSS